MKKTEMTVLCSKLTIYTANLETSGNIPANSQKEVFLKFLDKVLAQIVIDTEDVIQ